MATEMESEVVMTERKEALVGSVMIHVLHAGICLLDANMKLVLPFCLLVIIQSTWVCKGNLTDLRRELHLSLAKGNPK
jgi:hypothetical protein